MISVVAVGQQTWWVRVDDTWLAVDPMLGQSFGTSTAVRFIVWPPRRVVLGAVPTPAAILITNEHLDHLHLPSLASLPPETEVFVPWLCPEAATDAIAAGGNPVRRLRSEDDFVVGDAVVSLVAGASEMPVWELRGASAWIRSRRGSGSIAVQSDTIFDPVGRMARCRPDIAIVTHNGQVPSPGHRSAWSNLIPFPSPDERSRGVSMLNEVFNTYSEPLGGSRALIPSGGAYVCDPPRRAPYRWSDPHELEALLEPLAIGVAVVGLRPGESVSLDSAVFTRESVHWIVPVDRPVPLDPPLPDDGSVAAELVPIMEPGLDDEEVVGAWLDGRAASLLISPLGRAALATDHHLGGSCGPGRFAVHARTADEHKAWVFDVTSCEFGRVDADLTTLVSEVPFGIDVHLADLAAVLRGEINIWEMASAASNQWFADYDRLTSPLAFLYAQLCESTSPGLAREVYARSSLIPLD